MFDVGKTPSAWNKKMLNDEHFKVVRYFENSRSVFPTVDIKGGVAITLRDSQSDFGAIKVFVSNKNLKNIMNKVLGKMEYSISDIMYSNTSYKYSELFFYENEDFINRVSGGSRRYLSSSVFSKFPEAFHSEKPSGNEKYARVIGRDNSERVIYYFKEKYLQPPSNYNNYKVFLASSNGSGRLGEKLSNPIIADPGLGATETFVSFGKFDDRYSAENLLKYFKTKFARLMLGTKKVTQGNKNSKVWQNVPIQDFSLNSEINWRLSIQEIDTQLYRKYDLTEDEILYIEETVDAMN